MKHSLFLVAVIAACSCNEPHSNQAVPSIADSVIAKPDSEITIQDTSALPPSLSDPVTNTEPTVRKIPDQPIPLPLVPRFPEGNEAMFTFIEKTMQYPDAAKKANIGGTVLVSFTVKSDGTLTDIKVQKGIGYGCDEEAIRIVKLMPKWIPAKSGGQPIDSDFSIPVNFNI